MIEEWKDVVGYEGYYMISNFGNVKSIARITTGNGGIGSGNGRRPIKERILKYAIHKDYKTVLLCVNGLRKTMKIHRLVGIAFIPNIYNKPQINHIDGNKFNNMVNNLEWVTALENQLHAIKNGYFNDSYAKRCKAVEQIDNSGNIVFIWKSATECGRNGYNRESVRDCCLGKQIKHKGYVWRFH